jgi:hypothetical protein
LDKTSQQRIGFSVFAFTWALACLFHQLSFADWRWYSFHGIALTCALLFVLYKPSSWKRFATFVFVDWVSVAYQFPTHPNHIVFSWIVNATILTSLAIVVYKNKGVPAGGLESKWHEAFAPWVRVELCVLYFFTVFHKLNVSYFNPDWSCAAKLHHEIHERFLFLPDARWALYAAIYGTLIIETAIPVFLLFRRTRVAAVILGLLFHGLLALHPHAGLISFSSTMTALFTTFLPLSIAAALQPGNEIRKVWRWGILGGGALVLLWASHSLLPSGLNLERFVAQAWKLGFVGYFVYLVFAITMVIRSLNKEQLGTQNMVGYWKANPALIFFPLILIVNGFGPYYGLKTQTSFSMFSNLHTEQGISNHLIVPSGLHITNWQYDVVEIIDSNEPDLIHARDRALLVVFLELRRMRTDAHEDFRVTFRRNGKVETFDMKRPETHSVLTPLGSLAKRYFMFRHLEQDPFHVQCQQ